MIEQDVLLTCQERQTRLRISADLLIRDLRDAAASLLRTGLPVPQPSLDRLKRFRSGFDETCEVLASVGSAVPQTLADIERELDSLELIQRALDRLEQVSRIRPREQGQFAAWERCLTDLTAWRTRLTAGDREQACRSAAEFLAPKTGLNAVFALVAESKTQSDDQWSSLLDVVTDVYGRELATAIARGKLTLAPKPRA